MKNKAAYRKPNLLDLPAFMLPALLLVGMLVFVIHVMYLNWMI